MKKKILSMVLTLCILAAFVPMTVQAYNGTQYGDLYYEINEDNTVTIIECDKSATSIVIPSEIDGKSVTSIGGAAFYGCSSIISIVIPNSVTSIGGEAFNNCSSLTSIDIPSSVTDIGSYIFRGCTSLESIKVDANNNYYSSQYGVLFNKSKTELICYPAGKKDKIYSIPNSVLSIEEYAFLLSSSLTNIVIPNSVTSINDYAFHNCTSLTSITLPNRVTSIDSGVFQGCTSLESVTIPHSVTVISTAFEDCNALRDVYYYGTKDDWDRIGGPKYYNTSLMNANIHFIVPYFTLAKMSQVAEITNTDSAEHTAAIIIPQYENGILKGVVSENVTFAAGEKKTYNLSGDYKVFVWDSLSGMYPLDK